MKTRIFLAMSLILLLSGSIWADQPPQQAGVDYLTGLADSQEDVVALSNLSEDSTEQPYEAAWIRQLGTISIDTSRDTATDGQGNVYIVGYTKGSLGGTNAGGSDAFVSKYDSAGNLLWTHQFGTSSNDVGYDISADGLGNVYIAGSYYDSLDGFTGQEDAFLCKFDSAGNRLWTRQIDTGSSEKAYCVSSDGLGNVYIGGYTEGSLGGSNAGGHDAFISKYDASGIVLWTRQFGTSHHEGVFSISADGMGNVYVTGYTQGSLEGFNSGLSDVFVAKYNSGGNRLWIRQFGTSGNDDGYDISADGLGNVYVTGYTNGSLEGSNAGDSDAFVAKYDSAGNRLWTRQFGTSGYDSGNGISADSLGNVYIAGVTEGSLGGPNEGADDVFVSKFDSEGNLLWTRQFGTPNEDLGYGISSDGQGNVYVTGRTKGSLGSANAGDSDAFVAKLVPVAGPQPGPTEGLVVDDFEGYNDNNNRIYDTWVDYFFNNTGMSVGHLNPPFAEWTIVHSGSQAMYMHYDNDGTVNDGTAYQKTGTMYYSEAERRWATPQDWTIGGAMTLSLWFRGNSGNTAEQLYIALQDSANNSAVVKYSNTAAMTISTWTLWNIPLTGFTGVNLQAIKKMSIGVGDRVNPRRGGAGDLYIDDIGLSGAVSPTSQPVSATTCPVVDTQCPAVSTQCPAQTTQCPVIQTQCPAGNTYSPIVQTQCPALDTQCPSWPTLCPACLTAQIVPPSTRLGEGFARLVQVGSKGSLCPVLDIEAPFVVSGVGR